MNHILDQIADYLENRLTPEQRREVEMHRDECDECSAALAFAMKLQAEALAQGLTHIRPDRIIALAGDSKAVTPAEQQHLAACESCRRELEWAAAGKEEEALGSEDVDEDRRRRAAPSFAKRWWPAAAVAAAAVIAIVIFLPRGSRDTPDYTALARIEALPVSISRGASEPGTFEAARLRGLELYRDGNYAGARAALEAALGLEPGNAEILLYLGSTELLQGNPADAARHLAAGTNRTETPALREELLWQLVHAHLAANKREEATSSLEEIIALDGRHADDAGRLLAEIRK